jgi:serralysin
MISSELNLRNNPLENDILNQALPNPLQNFQGDPIVTMGLTDLINNVVGGIGNLIGSIDWNSIADGAANLITSVDWNNVAGFVTDVADNISPGAVVSLGGTVVDAVSDVVGFFIPETDFINLISTVGKETANFIGSQDINIEISGNDLANIGLTLLNLEATRSNLFLNLVTLAAQGAAAGLFDDAGFDGDVLDLNTRLDARQSGGWRFLDGNDYVLGSVLGDVINVNEGIDYLVGLGGSDFLRGGKESDRLDGGEDDDVLNGNMGNDQVQGGIGNDFVRGGQGDDLVDGGAGEDVVVGDRDFDILIGGADADYFVLRAEIAGEDAGKADRIADFNAAEGDRIKVFDCDSIEDMGLGSIDVNSDGAVDTAIICGNKVVGVVMGKDPTIVKDYIDLVSQEDQLINIVG